MGQKWGRNDGIHIGDVFYCWGPPTFALCSERAEHYQVIALRGKAQVVLRALRSEPYINENVKEGSPLWRIFRERSRPLPGQFMAESELEVTPFMVNGKLILTPGWEVTAWVLPFKSPEGRYRLIEVGWKKGVGFDMEYPEDWESWDEETIKRLEEKARAEEEQFLRKLEAKTAFPL